jgi:hypothetical protein
MMKQRKKLEEEVTTGSGISVHPHRFGGEGIPFRLRYALKTASDPHRMLERRCANLHLNPPCKLLLEPFAKTQTTFRLTPLSVQGYGHSNLYFEGVHNALSKEM